ncbi:MAG: glycosyltransferase family 2 protein [Planctomycetota bacterium]|jgi:hypothetical protein|nr:glycosyltransferase family 2 protein [Planctomycetota bacterium]
MSQARKLSVIIPVKEEQDNLRPLHERLTAALEPLTRPGASPPLADYEIVLVDDGSRDRSMEVLRELACADSRVKVVRLRRNYGQTPALKAGIDHATGDLIATMDGDLQNDPADLPVMLRQIDEGHDAVFGERARRQDDLFLRKVPSLLANGLIRKVTGCSIRDMGCTIRVMRADIARELPLYGELHRFIPVLVQMTGARMVQIPARHHARVAGVTKYNLTRTFRVVLDLITVQFLHTYLARPMHAMGMFGLACMGLGFCSLAATIIMKWTTGLWMTGNPFLLLSALFVLIGTQSIGLGLLGEVLSRTYFESQGKRSYAVSEAINVERGTDARRAA